MLSGEQIPTCHLALRVDDKMRIQLLNDAWLRGRRKAVTAVRPPVSAQGLARECSAAGAAARAR